MTGDLAAFHELCQYLERGARRRQSIGNAPALIERMKNKRPSVEKKLLRPFRVKFKRKILKSGRLV